MASSVFSDSIRVALILRVADKYIRGEITANVAMEGVIAALSLEGVTLGDLLWAQGEAEKLEGASVVDEARRILGLLSAGRTYPADPR